ncbi:MAG TPA: polyphenol oxidase family protein [Candidatus Babeliales bacterium]|jgi:hypothetical protein|nr:polyphenol oxidase family protein [Candidatus Babeliales bacterium]
MVVFRHNGISIFFGNADTKVFPEQYRPEWQQTSSILAHTSFNFLQKELAIDHLIFAHQVHGTDMLPITEHALPMRSFIHNADGLYTSIYNIGMGILTADCTPIIIHNPEEDTVAIMHIGWRGALNGIIPNNIYRLCSSNTNISKYIIYIGPGARQCCYMIDATLAHTFDQTIHGYTAITEKNGNYFLDIPTYIISQLQYAGITDQAINTTYALCTICNISFCSYRRQKELAGRQITVVSLQKQMHTGYIQ